MVEYKIRPYVGSDTYWAIKPVKLEMALLFPRFANLVDKLLMK